MRIWVCDVNGVLIDSLAVLREAFETTAARFRIPLTARDLARVKGLWLVEAYRVLDPGGDAFARQRFHLDCMRERLGEIRAYPSVRDVLAAARAAGVAIGAATSHGEIAEACLVRTGLYASIDCLVTQEEVAHRKPHPESIQLVLALFERDGFRSLRDEALYVGDTPVDVRAGKAAGVHTVGVSYGLADEAEMRAESPDHLIDDFAQMRMFLDAAKGVVDVPEIARAADGEDVGGGIAGAWGVAVDRARADRPLGHGARSAARAIGEAGTAAGARRTDSCERGRRADGHDRA